MSVRYASTHQNHGAASGSAFRKAKKKAAESGKTVASLIEEGLNFVLSDSDRPHLNRRVKLPVSKASGGTLAGVDLNHSSSLAADSQPHHCRYL